MVDTMKEHLSAAGVAEADQEHVIVFASLVQKEAGLAADYPKVARVFQNRLDQGMRLQSDATVAYGTGNTHTGDDDRRRAGRRVERVQHVRARGAAAGTDLEPRGHRDQGRHARGRRASGCTS